MGIELRNIGKGPRLISNRLSVFVAMVLALFVSFGISPVQGQTLQAKDIVSSATYDIASIRPFKLTGNTFQRVIPRALHEGTFRATAITVKVLIELAYGLQESQIQGGPAWVNGDLYTIYAKADPSLDQQLKQMPDEDAKLARQHMLQALLADRFNLKVRSIERKSGSKLQLSAPANADDEASTAGRLDIHMDGDTMVCQQTPLSRFVELLSEMTQQDIVDQTGLTGKYDFKVRFHRERPGDTSLNSDSNSPSIEDALPEQLGLKLKSQKGQIEELVIDNITKPTPN